MSKVTAIEKAIIQLGAGEFQKFCDTFLSKKKQYGAILGLGMKAGTLKTTKGNPDTYFVRENGKYVFVAYTTQQVGIFSKIETDIVKCMDSAKTGIQLTDIEEIVCCHTSSDLSAGDDQKLHKMCSEKGIKLTLYGVDEIAQQVYNRYPMLARDFLGISIDTNQIMSVSEFIRLYDSSKTAAPLDTIFQYREKELAELVSAIRNGKVVVVYGSAGVGKTRITLEAIRKVAIEDEYKLLCVKSNNLELYNDLVANTENPGKYLFFVDDADGLSGLNLILDYITKEDQGYEIKVIMTVRDYAKGDVISVSAKYIQPYLCELTAFTDDEIREFLKVNMEITDDQFVEPIIKIAEGNLRIAYMAGRIAIETHSIEAMHDVTQVYEQYYASVIKSGLSNNYKLCLTAGVLALVKAVMIEKLDNLDSILQTGDLTREEFLNCIRQLSAMEVVEIHLDKVASISDQCFANYMLYYVFFAEKQLPFCLVLKVGFIYFRKGIIQSIDTLLNLFAKDELRTYIKEEVIKTWDAFKIENDRIFEDFAREFHVFKPREAFIIVNDKIELIPQKTYKGTPIDFSHGTFKSDDKILGFLTGYQCSSYLDTVLELLIKYIEKSEENAVVGYTWLENNYGIDSESYRYDYYNEKKIAKKLSESITRSEIVQRFILAYVSYVLGFEFRSTKLGRGNTFTMYTVKPLNSIGLKEYRESCWKSLEQFVESGELQDEVIDVIKKYAIAIRTAEDSSIIVDDLEHITKIVSGLRCSDFKKNLITRDLYYGWEKQGIEYKSDTALFETEEWKLYSLLEDKWFYSDLEYEDYEKQHNKALLGYADTLDDEHVRVFFVSASAIIKEVDEDSKYAVIHAINCILERICENKELTDSVFSAILQFGNDLGLDLGYVLPNLFKIKTASGIWSMINQVKSDRENEWKLSFFQAMPSECTNIETYDWLLDFLREKSDKDITSSSYRKLRFLDKFIAIDKEVYVTVSRIILEKKSYNAFIVKMYFAMLFNEYCYTPEEVKNFFSSDLELLKEVFFFTIKNDNMADCRGTFLVEFLTIDESWVDAYADVFCEKIQDGGEHEYYTYFALWKSEGYIRYFDAIFEKVVGSIGYIYKWRLTNGFTKVLTIGEENEQVQQRQEEWVLHIIEKYATDNKILCLFEALSETRPSLREKAIQKFLLCNDDFEMFNKIQLDPDHWGGFAEEIIPDLQRRIDFLQSLLPLMTGIKYLKHAQKVQARIDFWKSEIKQEELKVIYRKFYL